MPIYKIDFREVTQKSGFYYGLSFQMQHLAKGKDLSLTLRWDDPSAGSVTIREESHSEQFIVCITVLFLLL